MITKQQTLDTLMLLSALESWSYSTNTHLPDYLFEKLGECVNVLRNELIGENNEQ